MNYYIITGTSRGLGEAIAEKLLNENNCLFCISRTKNSKLISLSDGLNTNLNYFEFDLNKLNEIEHLLDDIFEKINIKKAKSINLINNAGTIKPVKALEKHTSEEIINSFNVNLIAPTIIASKFIERTLNYSCEKRIINISSGAAKKPYDGWSTYCSSKAALDMLTRCVNVEQNKKEFPVNVISFDPGIMDTEMQNDIRQSNKEDFSQLSRFIDFKENGALLSAEFVADKVIEVLSSDNFQTGEFIKVWDMS
jgi:benzil reductase ((S)-benzoin forming)